MNPYNAYKQQQAVGWTRIDLVLALYDGAISRLEKARDALQRGDSLEATSLLVRAQLIVAELAGGIDLKYGEIPLNLLRLYNFAAQKIKECEIESINDALRILTTLREGMLNIRDEAVRLERTGTIPPLESSRLVQATA